MQPHHAPHAHIVDALEGRRASVLNFRNVPGLLPQGRVDRVRALAPMMRRAFVLSAWLIAAWVAPAIAEQSTIAQQNAKTMGGQTVMTPGTPSPPPATPAPTNPYSAIYVASRYGQAGQLALPSGYSNGLIPYNPSTGVLDPAFVAALGFGDMPMTVQQFQQYWNAAPPGAGSP